MNVAHGKIRITSETQQVKEAQTSLSDFEARLSALGATVTAANLSLDRFQRQLKQTARDLRDVDRSTIGFHENLDLGTQSFDRGRKSVVGYTGELQALIATFRQMKSIKNQYFDPIEKIHQSMQTWGLTPFGKKADFSVPVATFAGFNVLKNHLLGIKAATADLPKWEKSLLNVAGGMTAFTVSLRLLGKYTNILPAVDRAFSSIANHTGILGDGLVSVRKHVTGLSSSFNSLPKDISKTIVGFAVMHEGLQRLTPGLKLFNKLPGWVKMIVGPGLLSIDPILQAIGKSLRVVSNLLVGLWDGIKQISGAALAVPAAFGIAIFSLAPMLGVIKTLKSNLKDFMSALSSNDPEKLAEAYSKLPDYMKSFAKAIQDVYPQIKGLGNTLTKSLLQGAPEQLRAMVAGYMPVLTVGSLQIVNAWKMAKDSLVSFLGQGKNMSDVSRMFMLTSQTINGLGMSIPGVASLLRDLGIVGAKYLSEMAAHTSILVDKWAEWARVNRANGNMLQWMEQGVKGFKDLYQGVAAFTKGVWTVLTIFKTTDGKNFLDFFRKDMEKFNNSMKNSAATGFLKRIGDSVRTLGTDKIKALTSSLKQVGDVIVHQVMPFLLDFNRALGASWGSGFSIVLTVFKEIFNVLNKMGIGSNLGWAVGLLATFKLLMMVISPLRGAIMAIWGAFTFGSGARALLLNLSVGLKSMGGVASWAADGIMKIRGALIAVGTTVGIVAALILGFYTVWSEGSKSVAAAHKSIDDTLKSQKESAQKLRDAFLADKGGIGRTVMDVLNEDINNMFNNLEDRVTKGPNFMARAKDFLKRSYTPAGLGKMAVLGPLAIGTTLTQPESEEIRGLEVSRDAALKAQQQFDKLRYTNQELADAIKLPTAEFDKLVASIRAQGFNEAADQLMVYRKQFTSLQEDFKKLGPGGAMVAAGIEQIGKAGGDATTKLEGLKLILMGLGLLKTDAAEAAFAYSQAIDDVANAAANAVDNSQPLDDILDKTGKWFNYASVNGRNLFNILEPLAQKFLAVASSGGDVQGAYQQLLPQIHAIAAAFGLTDQQVVDLLTHLGVVPAVVSIAVQLDGKDNVIAGIGEVLITASQNVGNGIEIPIAVKDPQKVSEEINNLFGTDATRAEGSLLYIKPGIDINALNVLRDYLRSKGIKLPDDMGGISKESTLAVNVSPGAPNVVAPGTPYHADQKELDALKTAITGTSQVWNDYIEKLIKENKVSKEFVETAKRLRSEWLNGGQAAREYADALDKMGDSTATASDKADTLIKALQQLGLLPGDVDKSIEDFNKTLKDTIGPTAQLADGMGILGASLILPNNHISNITENGEKLLKGIQDLQHAGFELAASGAVGPAEAWQKSHDAMMILLNDFGIFGPQAEDIINTYLLPEHTFEIQFLVKGKTEVQNELTALETQLDKVKDGGKIQISVSGEAGAADLKKVTDSLGLEISQFDPTTNTVTVTVPPGMDITKTKQQIDALLNKNPTQLKTELDLPKTDPKKLLEDSTGISEKNPLKIPAELYIAPPGKTTPGTPGTPGTPETPGAPGAPGQVPGPGTPAPSGSHWVPDPNNPNSFVLAPDNPVTLPSPNPLNPYPTPSGPPVTLASSITSLGDSGVAHDAGLTFGNDFAAGITDSEGTILGALAKILQDLQDQLPVHSPAKKGPLSGSGWTYLSGVVVSSDFAAGITQGGASVAGATKGVAGIIGNILSAKQGPATAGFLKHFEDILHIFEHAFDIGDKIFTAVQTFAKGTATLFKKKIPAGNIPYVGAAVTPAAPAGLPGAQPGNQPYTAGTIDWDAVAKAESSGNWQDANSGGYATPVYGGLQFKQETWDAYGGQEFAKRPDQATREQQITVANRVAFTGWRGTPPQGLKAWQSIVEGKVPGITVDTKPGAPPTPAVPPTPAPAVPPVTNQPPAPTGPGPAGSVGAPKWLPDGKGGGKWAWLNASGAVISTVTTPAAPAPAPAPSGKVGRYYDRARNAWIDASTGQPLPVGPSNLPVIPAPSPAPAPAAPAGAARPGIIHGGTNQPAAQATALAISALFPWVTDIGGQRPDDMPYHQEGRALDVHIPNWNTPEGKALGDQLKQWALANAKQIGLEDVIWQQFWQPAGGGQGNLMKDRGGPTQNHFDHVHLTFTSGAQVAFNGTNTFPSGAPPAVLAAAATPGATTPGVGEPSAVASAAGSPGAILDQVSSIGSGVASIAKDIFGVIDSGLQSIEATKTIEDTLVRGVASTKDVSKIIDQVQVYIETAAKVATTVGDVLNTVGGFMPSDAGGADFGGMAAAKMAMQMAALVAQIVAAGLETTNAIIDLVQEVNQTVGSFVGEFLTGMLGVGEGDIKFLLDTTTGKVMTYNAQNPLLKSAHPVPGMLQGAGNQQLIGQINMYGGPGSDPRDMTRSMVYQVKASQFAGATAQ